MNLLNGYEDGENDSNMVIRQDSNQNIFVSDVGSKRNVVFSAMKSKKNDDGLLFMPKEHFQSSDAKKPPLGKPRSMYAASITDSGVINKSQKGGKDAKR